LSHGAETYQKINQNEAKHEKFREFDGGCPDAHITREAGAASMSDPDSRHQADMGDLIEQSHSSPAIEEMA